MAFAHGARWYVTAEHRFAAELWPKIIHTHTFAAETRIVIVNIRRDAASERGMPSCFLRVFFAHNFEAELWW